MAPKETFRLNRRTFLKGSAAATAAAFGTKEVLAVEDGPPRPKRFKGVAKVLQSQCPYCGVGCGTLIQVDKNDRIIGVVPDKEHSTNKGTQCIKGLNAYEPTYVDRLKKVLVRKDMTDPLTGHISKTKGRFDDDVWREATWEEAEELVAEKIAGIAKKFGGNSVGLYGSGQLTLESQWVENKLMKGVLGSNTMEANARMCMTSAVTAYFKTFGSDTPPTCYDDVEDADMITFWGHNPRGAHAVLFWRVADYKNKRRDVVTVVSDPRRTGTVQALEAVNPRNSYHISTINGDISCLNAIAHVILTKHPDAVDWDFLKEHTTDWESYVEGVKARYSPEQVVDRTGVEPELIREIAAHWAEASIKGRKRRRGGVLSFWGIGYNQHIHGQHNVISVINLHALTGNIGRPGAGPFSMTGQPNAMGERLMGGLTGRLPFNKGIKDAAHRKHIASVWSVPEQNLVNSANSQNPGYAIGMMERAMKGDVKAMFFVYTTHIDLPDVRTLVRPAMERSFVVVQDIYRHAPNLLYGDVIFPAATWGEWQGGIYIQSERRLYVVDGTGTPPDNCQPDLDMAIDKGKLIANKLGLDGEKIFPYKKLPNGLYDSEEVFREIIRGSKGTDSDITGILEVEKETGKSPYQQIRELRGIQWPAPNKEIAKEGGAKRRFLGQEGDWKEKPYGAFRTKTGKMRVKLCEQDYSKRAEIIKELSRAGTEEGFYLIDHPELLKAARDMALTPELPDLEFADSHWKDVPEDKYPFWLGLGIVYEHFHTAKTIRGATTRKLVPEQYLEMHPDDAEANGLRDGDKVRITTRRGSFDARLSVGGSLSKVKPARNEVPKGYIFSPWNLSVADSADPKKNRWLVNAVSHRAWDPVSGQVDYKKLAARIEKI